MLLRKQPFFSIGNVEIKSAPPTFYLLGQRDGGNTM